MIKNIAAAMRLSLSLSVLLAVTTGDARAPTMRAFVAAFNWPAQSNRSSRSTNADALGANAISAA